MAEVDSLFTDVQSDQSAAFLGMYLDEDMGLKNSLSGLTVTDLNARDNEPRPVPVWFLNPEREVRRITYPSITINFLSERVAHEREHRGRVLFYYKTLQDVPLDGDAFLGDYPIPMDLDYQIVVHTRVNQHMSQLNGRLMQGPLHPRFAQINCPGGTVRRLEVMGMTTANGQDGDKRIFRHMYQVRIPTEVEYVPTAHTRVSEIILRMTEMGTRQVVLGPTVITATEGLVSNTLTQPLGSSRTQIN